METLESALALLIEHTAPVREIECMPLLGALGRICAQEVASPIDVPPFDRSPLDGYALHRADNAGATREHPAHLTVIGEACAGCGERFAVGRGQEHLPRGRGRSARYGDGASGRCAHKRAHRRAGESGRDAG